MLSLEELNLIKGCFLFRKSKEDELQSFLESEDCLVCSFSKGENILLGGKEDKRLGLLLSGKASALCAGGGQGSLKTFSAGEIFGAAEVFSKANDQPFSKMKAVTNCRVLFVTRKGVERLIFERPERALEYIAFLSDRVAFLNRRISTFTAREAVSRVAKFLLENAEKGSVCRNINFSALAKTLDISRASLYRAKSELIKIKAIATDKKDIIILDRQALKNII